MPFQKYSWTTLKINMLYFNITRSMTSSVLRFILQVRWLYAHGCRCKTCGDLYAEMKPLAQAVSRLGALGKPNLREGTENGDAMALAQAGMAAVSRKQLQHEATDHGGQHVHYSQVILCTVGSREIHLQVQEKNRTLRIVQFVKRV